MATTPNTNNNGVLRKTKERERERELKWDRKSINATVGVHTIGGMGMKKGPQCMASNE